MTIANEILDAIARRMEDRLDEAWTLGRLAEESGYSPFYLHHQFERRIGEAPMRYLRRLRMERAALWLIYSDRSIPQIAEACGFSSRQGFGRSFTRYFGRAPEEYRKTMAKVIAQRARSRAVQKAAGAVRVLTMREKHISCLRHTGHYWSLPALWRLLVSWTHGLPEKERPRRYYLLNYDDRLVTKAIHTRYDLGCDSAEPSRLPFHRVTLPEGPTAVLSFQGRLDDWLNAWRWFAYCWLRESRWHVRGNFFWDEVDISSEFALRGPLRSTLTRAVFASRLHIPLQRCGDVGGIPVTVPNAGK